MNKLSGYMEKLLGLYDKDTMTFRSVGASHRDLGHRGKSLYRFFCFFPIYKDVEDYTVVDVDYYVEKAEDRKQAERDVRAVREFYNYLIDFLGFQMLNPASSRSRSDWAKRLAAGNQHRADASNVHAKESRRLDSRHAQEHSIGSFTYNKRRIRKLTRRSGDLRRAKVIAREQGPVPAEQSQTGS